LVHLLACILVYDARSHLHHIGTCFDLLRSPLGFLWVKSLVVRVHRPYTSSAQIPGAMSADHLYGAGCLSPYWCLGVAPRLYTGWTVRGSNAVRDEICRTRSDRPWGPPSLLYMSSGSFTGVKRPGRGLDHPPHLAPRLKKDISTSPLGCSIACKPTMTVSFAIVCPR